MGLPNQCPEDVFISMISEFLFWNMQPTDHFSQKIGKILFQKFPKFYLDRKKNFLLPKNLSKINLISYSSPILSKQKHYMNTVAWIKTEALG